MEHQSEFPKSSGHNHTVQDILLSSLEAVCPPPPCDAYNMTDDEEEQRRRRPSSAASRIPIRQRDSSSPPSLAGSGRSTPVQPAAAVGRPPMRREGSSPPGLLTTPNKRTSPSPPPPIAPKPSPEKIGFFKLSQPNSGKTIFLYQRYRPFKIRLCPYVGRLVIHTQSRDFLFPLGRPEPNTAVARY
jgi:hypothetical protein